MTWLLAKLGLQLADGAGLGRLAGVLALVAVVAVSGGLAVWYVADLGKQAALARCDREKVAERDRRRLAEDRAREALALVGEANREVIVRHTADTTRLEATLDRQEKEVKDHVAANPQLVLCGLNDRGLRIWNADPLEPGAGADPEVQGGPRPPGAEPVEPAARPGGHSAAAPGEPRRLEAGLQGPLAQAPGPGGAGAQLLGGIR